MYVLIMHLTILRIELRFIYFECSDGVSVAVHVAGPAFHASRFEDCEIERVEGVPAHGGVRPTGVTIGSLDDVFMLRLNG